MGTESLSALQTAQRLASLGYHCIPVLPRTKAAAPKDWVSLRLRAEDMADWWGSGDSMGVGLLLSTKVADACFVIGIDVDTDDTELIENIRHAFPVPLPGKKGAKGITFFVRQPHPMKKRILKRKDSVTGQTLNLVELLAAGQQTVLPPSIHPRGMDYKWVGTPLYDIPPLDLPEFTEAAIKELELAVANPTAALFQINYMEWQGKDGGGNIHDSTLAAVGAMVAYKWTDEQIWARVDRETRRAVLEFGDDYDWPGWEQEVNGMIVAAREKGYAEEPKKERIHKIVARWFMQDFVGDGKVYNRDGRVALYKAGAFDLKDPSDIRHLISEHYREPKDVSLHSPDWVIVTSNVSDMSPRFPTVNPKRRVCMRNGTFDMDSGVLGEHSPNDHLISRLQFNYDPEATAPRYQEFLRETFNLPDAEDSEKALNTYEEFIAHTLFECTDYHKFLVLKGPTRTGKSTLIKIARMLHGPDAVSAVPVHEFGNERYRTAMVGKLLNIVSEVASTSHAADDFLKAVTAGDEVQVRFLYAEPQLVKLPSRLVIACNEMFRVRDTSGAIEARMLLLSCNNTIPPEKIDIHLTNKLREEMAGVFNRMVKAWARLRDRGHFDPPISAAEEVATFSLENNHTLQWLQERTVEGASVDHPDYVPEPGAATDVSQLYFDYSEWSKLNGFKTISSVTFGMKLSQVGPPIGPLPTTIKWMGKRAVRVRPLTLISEGKY